MKVARYEYEGEISFGILDQAESGGGIEIVELSSDPMMAEYDTTGRRIPFADVRLLAPVIPRSKIVCVGKNYADHVAEMAELTGPAPTPDAPLLFLKPNTSIIGPGDPILLPSVSNRVEHEGELAIIIGAVAKNVTEEEALSVVFGFTCANDVTARDIQIADGQWMRGKSFDTFCPIGPIVETDPDLADALITTRVNGELRQEGRTSELIFGLARIVSYASQAFTLLPGDVILTGTPAGVGPIVAGDTVEVHIDGIGTLRNPVRAA